MNIELVVKNIMVIEKVQTVSKIAIRAHKSELGSKGILESQNPWHTILFLDANSFKCLITKSEKIKTTNQQSILQCTDGMPQARKELKLQWQT